MSESVAVSPERPTVKKSKFKSPRKTPAEMTPAQLELHNLRLARARAAIKAKRKAQQAARALEDERYRQKLQLMSDKAIARAKRTCKRLWGE